MIIKYGKLDYISNKHAFNNGDVFFSHTLNHYPDPIEFLIIARQNGIMECYSQVYLFLSPENEL